jgi:mannose-6-phosphate isomerase-like protein (cupin superfamily)
LPFVVHEQDCPLERWEDVGGGLDTWRTLVSADRTPTHHLTVGVVDIACLPDGVAPEPRHRHDPAETYYVISGEGFVEIGDEISAVRTGNAAYIPGGCWHRAWSEHREGMRILYTFPVDSFTEVAYEFEPHLP